MERSLGIEEARARLGQLAADVSSGGEPIVLTKRGQSLAVMISRDEYSRLKESASRLIRQELEGRLVEVRRRVEEAGLQPDAVDEAIAAARRLQ